MNAFTKAAPKPATLESLTLAWLMAKQQEQEANARRVDIEAQIAAALPAFAEGTSSAIVGDYKVAVKYGVTRKVDSDKLQALWQDLAPQAQAAFRWKADIALPKLRALQEMLPDTYAKLADVIETKPSKPSVSVDAIAKAAA